MTSRKRSRAQWRVPAMVVSVFALCITLGSVGAATANTYCGIWVPGNTDCANVAGGSWANGYFDQNVVSDPNGWLVCQHTYLYGTGTTVSRHCGETPEGAGWDLMCYYVEGRALSGHAGNANAFSQPIFGSAYIETVRCV